MSLSIPAAMALSTGLAEEACTRTSTCAAPTAGAGRSSRTTGGVPKPSGVTALIAAVLSSGWADRTRRRAVVVGQARTRGSAAAAAAAGRDARRGWAIAATSSGSTRKGVAAGRGGAGAGGGGGAGAGGGARRGPRAARAGGVKDGDEDAEPERAAAVVRH